MALNACRECGKEVSDLAEKCPHCGAPSPVPKGVGNRIATLLVVGTLVMIGYWVITSVDSPGPLSGPAVVQPSSPAAGPVAAAVSGSSFTLIVVCSPGLPFTGTYMAVSAQGSTSTHDIKGPCPKSGRIDIKGSAALVSATAQKSIEEGTIRLVLTVGGKTPAVSESSQPYGVAMVSQ